MILNKSDCMYGCHYSARMGKGHVNLPILNNRTQLICLFLVHVTKLAVMGSKESSARLGWHHVPQQNTAEIFLPPPPLPSPALFYDDNFLRIQMTDIA